MTNRPFHEPSPQELEHGRLVANEMIEAINRLLREGMTPKVVLAGMANAAADTIASLHGTEYVAPWFEGMAANARDLQRRH